MENNKNTEGDPLNIGQASLPKKNHLGMIIAVLVVLGVVAGGIWLWQGFSPVAPAPGQTDQNTNPTPNPSANEASEVEGWKIYRNEEYGFEFKYPSEWKDQGRDIAIQNYFSKAPYVTVLNIELIIDTMSLTEIAEKEIEASACPGDRVIEAKQVGVLYVLHCSASSESYVFISDLHSRNKIKFWYHDNFEDEWEEEQKLFIFKQILSTFKFIK